MDYIKGNRIGSREAEIENSSGWRAVRKVHRSKRSYNRKDKHKKSGGNNPDFFLPTDSLSTGGWGHPSGKSFSAIKLFRISGGKTFHRDAAWDHI